ncbi:mitochondrial protein up-regulated during meiosis domain-containing protein [Sarocladium implicatum]|nr:mitochondrial protein up-regulated during meiosis domain-containing protein [Sarocladium implicatum]
MPGELSRTYFDSTGIRWVGIAGKEPPDPNKANLGKTLRILQDRLPTLLQSPLPQSLLAPNISLNLFPSTHPHLPTVSGRVAYTAALWSSPIAWNRVPIIGNVKLEILAERMTAEPLTFLPRRPGAIPEQLVVRWCEKRKPKEGGAGQEGEGSRGFASALNLGGGVDSSKAFTGLFIFDFDKEGRILTHTIETAQQGGNWEKGVGAKFVGLTDWLLGGMRDPGEPAPMFERLLKPENRRVD